MGAVQAEGRGAQFGSTEECGFGGVGGAAIAFFNGEAASTASANRPALTKERSRISAFRFKLKLTVARRL
jgi:hypothetical protein